MVVHALLITALGRQRPGLQSKFQDSHQDYIEKLSLKKNYIQLTEPKENMGRKHCFELKREMSMAETEK